MRYVQDGWGGTKETRMQKQMGKTARAAFGTAITVLGIMAAWAQTASPARADVKIVSEQSLTGMEDWGLRSLPIKVTRYFKGDMMREEYQGRNIVHIYDSKADKYYTLDRNTQTYAVQTLDEVTNDAAGGLAQLAVIGDVTVAEGGSTQTIAGKPAKNYSTSANLLIKSERSGMKVIDVKMQGEQWTTGTIALPSTNPRLVRAAYLLSTNAHKLFKPFYDKVTEIKGLPLSFDQILTFQTMPGITLNGARQGTIEAHGDVQAVSTAVLPDYLFHVPKTFKLVPRISPRL